MEHTQNQMNLTDSEIESAWDAGNNAGEGYAVGEDGMTPLQAAEHEEMDDIRTCNTHGSTGHCVIARDGAKWVAICDANGPWAVDIQMLEEAE